MSVKKGFSLIELLVSMAVGYFLISVLFSALWVIYNRLACIREYNSTVASLAVAHDIMERDLKGIPCERALFKKITPNELIWPLGSGVDRGYEIVEASLKRIEGHYDVKSGQWHDAARSVVLNGVNRCQFDVENGASHIGGIKITLSVQVKKDEVSDTFVVCARNRQIG